MGYDDTVVLFGAAQFPYCLLSEVSILPISHIPYISQTAETNRSATLEKLPHQAGMRDSGADNRIIHRKMVH